VSSRSVLRKRILLRGLPPADAHRRNGSFSTGAKAMDLIHPSVKRHTNMLSSSTAPTVGGWRCRSVERAERFTTSNPRSASALPVPPFARPFARPGDVVIALAADALDLGERSRATHRAERRPRAFLAGPAFSGKS
jgi:hypothetical protein